VEGAWSELRYVTASDNKVEAVAADSNITVSKDGDNIVIGNPDNETITVYAINGAVVSTTSASTATLNLPAGVYVVKAASATFKLVK
jgi:hypothetical protein